MAPGTRPSAPGTARPNPHGLALHGSPRDGWRVPRAAPGSVCPFSGFCIGLFTWPPALQGLGLVWSWGPGGVSQRGRAPARLSPTTPRGEPSVWSTCILFPELNCRLSGLHDAHAGQLPCRVGGGQSRPRASAVLRQGCAVVMVPGPCKPLALLSLSLPPFVCLHRLSAGRGEDAWVSFPRLVSTVGPGCAHCPECPGGVHVIPLSQVMTCVLPQPLHRAQLWWH